MKNLLNPNITRLRNYGYMEKLVIQPSRQRADFMLLSPVERHIKARRKEIAEVKARGGVDPVASIVTLHTEGNPLPPGWLDGLIEL